MATKVLVLENKEGIAELLTFSLSSDYDVHSASNCDEALTIIEKENPALVIFDITATDMDGIEFLCKIKKINPPTEVITLADMEQKDLAVTCLKYEASDFIIKPVTGETLEIILERAMKKLAIKRRLSTTSSDSFPSVMDSERLTVLKQMMDMISANDALTNKQGTILSLHTKRGSILKTNDEHKKIFGNMEGKKSWEIFKKGAMSPESCPAAQAFKTRSPYIIESAVSLKNGDENMAKLYATPIFNQNDQADLVMEFLTLL